MNLQRKGFLSLLIMMIIGAFAFVACDDDNVEKPKVITGGDYYSLSIKCS